MKKALLATLIGLLATSAASAQVPGISLNVFPRVGQYKSFGSLGEVLGEDVKIEGGTAIGLSAELGVPILPFSIRGSMDYALSAETSHSGTGGDVRGDGVDVTVLGLSADLVLRLAPGISPVQPYLLGGIGIRKYAFDDQSAGNPEDASDTAFHVGAGLSVGLGPFRVVGEVSDYISKFEFSGDDSLRNDVFIMVGFKIGLF